MDPNCQRKNFMTTLVKNIKFLSYGKTLTINKLSFLLFLLTTIYQAKLTTHSYVFFWGGDFLITNRKMQQFVEGAVKQDNNKWVSKSAKCLWMRKKTKPSNNKTPKCYHFISFCNKGRIRFCVFIWLCIRCRATMLRLSIHISVSDHLWLLQHLWTSHQLQDSSLSVSMLRSICGWHIGNYSETEKAISGFAFNPCTGLKLSRQ